MKTRTEEPKQWNTMPTQMLLEQASALSKEHDYRSYTARCIDALIWRLKADEEWIASQARRAGTP